MDRDLVQSSTIRSIGHDPETMTLEIEFNDGAVYQYFDVPKSVHKELIEAPSLGRFFGRRIRDQFRYVKL